MATPQGINSNSTIEELLIESSIENFEILPAILGSCNVDNTLSLDQVESHVSLEILNELTAGTQHPVRKAPVTDAEELKTEKFSAYVKAFFGGLTLSNQDIKKIEEALNLNPDLFLKGGGNYLKLGVKKCFKAVEIALQQTDTTDSSTSIPSIYEMSKQGVFGGIDGGKFPAWQPQYVENQGTGAQLSEIKENEIFPLAFTELNKLIRAINKCNTKANVIFAGTNLYTHILSWKENNKHLFDKDKYDFSENKYFGIPVIELSYAKWIDTKEFTNRACVFGKESLQARENTEQLTATKGDGIENAGQSRVMKIITLVYYFLIAPYNRAGCGQIYFPNLEIKK